MGSYIGRLDVEDVFADHSNRVLQCDRHLLRRDVTSPASQVNGRYRCVVVGVLVVANSPYDGGRRTDRAHDGIVGRFVMYGITLLVLLLHLERYGDAICEVEEVAIVREYLAILDESDVSKSKYVRPTFLCLWDLQILTGSHSKEEADYR